MPLLRVENLTVRPRYRRLWLQYRQKQRKILDDLNFDIEAGSITSLVGDAGSGKLALSLAILRVENVAKGAVYFEDGEENILKLKRRRFRKIQRQIQLLMPDEQDPLNPHQSIHSQMRQLLKLYFPKFTEKEFDQRISEALSTVNLPPAILSRRPGQMIAAHRQRAAIARAIAVDPKLLICHDLTAGIDVTIQAELLNLLKDLRDQFELTIFMMTDNLAIADHMSDHMLILNRGRIVESGTPEAIVRDPQHDYTRRLVASTTSLR